MWTPEFTADLAKSVRRPVFLVRVIRVGDSPGGHWAAASAPGLGHPETLVAGSIQMSGQSVTPGQWSASPGVFGFSTFDTAEAIFGNIVRGTFVALYCGWAGCFASDLQRIGLGVVKSITWRQGVYKVTCWDLWAALQGRPTTNAIGQRLFYNVGTQVTLAAGYAVGDSTVQVTSAASFGRESGAYFGLKITPDTGDEFYLRASSLAGSTFTINTPGADRMGTTRATASSGAVVTAVAHITGHPIDIAYKVLASSSGSGPFDLYPDDWGYGVPDDMLDKDDRVMWQSYAVKVATGAYDLEFTVDESQDDAFAWFSGFLASFSMFPAIRQGQLTIRAGQNMGAPLYVSDLEIKDSNIILRDVEYFAFEEAMTDEVHRVQVSTPNDSASGDDSMVTLPGRDQQNIYVPYVYDNEQAVADEVLARSRLFHMRVPERWRLPLVGLTFAALTPGDVVPFTSQTLVGRLGRSGYRGRLAFVAQVSPDWIRGTVMVDLLIYSTSDAVLGGL